MPACLFVVLRLDGDEYGVYMLGHEASDDDSIAIIVYVGRGEIQDRLADHLNNDAKPAILFYFKPLDDADEDDAFEEECRLFHQYGKTKHLYNRIHPAVPAGSRFKKKCSERGCNGEP